MEQFKEPYKRICGICQRDMGRVTNPEGVLGYCGCEEELPRYT